MKSERGVAAVELVIALPALIVVLLLVVGAGRVVQTKQALLAVAREAATIGAQAQNESQAATAATQRARQVASGLGLDPSALSISIGASGFGRGANYWVTVRYPVRILTAPGLSRLPASVSLSASHAEQIERYKSR